MCRWKIPQTFTITTGNTHQQVSLEVIEQVTIVQMGDSLASASHNREHSPAGSLDIIKHVTLVKIGDSLAGDNHNREHSPDGFP